ncbi:serine phosphatase RsbU (regulator of sigma subunit) [Prauserella shujinwangii]|uniref:Serine phosphatase RsbU (Regulator of sigma subunit) n=1 Tax=Prauserella shujinwangii TaxID=1453103 RepID=A0A2T0LZZ3_9PSEU|nr:SpoIIE family protein phosphatase [Prauserella shujinwangii]PRX49923.1 serine phosphatase RsbU (regulator of sigma subunit) [Prauserella shujinwangii]
MTRGDRDRSGEQPSLPAELEHAFRGRRLPARVRRVIVDELGPGASSSDLAEAVRALVEVTREQDRELRWHQSELEQTNAGLLALHAEIDRQRQRNAFLDAVSRASATSLDGVEMLDVVATLLSSREFAERIQVWKATDTGLLCLADPASQPDATTQEALRTREPAQEGAHRLSVPLTAGPHVLGVLDLHRADREFGSDDVSLARGIADRAAVGLRNAIVYEREHELAERLQHAMLPSLTPQAELDLAARYRSATRGVHVGGDWYDVVSRPDGTVVLTVGDVTGHGLDAAVVMGKLQNALHAYALEGHGPATSLRLVHQLLRGWTSSLFATAVVVEVEKATGVMRWASAGHPPPLLESGDGHATYLDAEHAPMLGINFRREIPEHKRQLTPGSSIVLYTDGLVERRTSDIDTGLDRLARAFTGAGTDDLDQRAERVLHSMLGADDHDDDVCLLLCRWTRSA